MNPTYGVAGWLIIGALAGWLASRIMRMGGMGRMGGLASIGAGVLGGLIGNAFMRFALESDPSHNGYVLSTLVALAGACGVMGLAKLATKLA
jgi:uncharacterized membrane protein YeaQ/YmgE (transglycosylase-associated protein family)